ncbi:MAG: helix-turn-helix domain-containing protein [Nitrospirota bacterium]|nr:helix-turn-helix domain-containing protein [Nitrospirota bacterium]MDE3225933.1 helix-turn-helix domain-containing protein [Nitrospirota bacterium]MDE3243834.1 helix-turn-helix domain-containing protein [Nitrospirota bacterium]
MDKPLLRVGEAAQALNVSRWTIYRWIEEGRLEATKLGKCSLRVFRESVTELVERNRVEDGRPVRAVREIPPRLRVGHRPAM